MPDRYTTIQIADNNLNFFFFQAEDGIRDDLVTGVQTCALPIFAMHVAAANPQALDPAGLDPAAIKREKDVLADKYRQQGKPENVIEKIVESGLKTYYKEVCLLEQSSIHAEHGGKSVAQAVKETEGKVGAPIKVAGFVRYALGEGIDKQESDFAAEVPAVTGKK